MHHSAAALDDDDRPAVVEDCVIADHDSVAWREGACETAALLIGIVVRDRDGDVGLARPFGQRRTSPVVAAQAAAVAGHDVADSPGSPPPAARCHVFVRRQEQECAERTDGNDQHRGAGEEPSGHPCADRRLGSWRLSGRTTTPRQAGHVSSPTRAPLSSASRAGVIEKTASGRPAAAQTTSWLVRSRSMKMGSMFAWPKGGTPPIEYPVASLVKLASALVTRPPARASRRPTFSRLAPLTRATTGRPPAVNTSDFTIWATSQPMARAASPAVRVPAG